MKKLFTFTLLLCAFMSFSINLERHFYFQPDAQKLVIPIGYATEVIEHPSHGTAKVVDHPGAVNGFYTTIEYTISDKKYVGSDTLSYNDDTGIAIPAIIHISEQAPVIIQDINIGTPLEQNCDTLALAYLTGYIPNYLQITNAIVTENDDSEYNDNIWNIDFVGTKVMTSPELTYFTAGTSVPHRAKKNYGVMANSYNPYGPNHELQILLKFGSENLIDTTVLYYATSPAIGCVYMDDFSCDSMNLLIAKSVPLCPSSVTTTIDSITYANDTIYINRHNETETYDLSCYMIGATTMFDTIPLSKVNGDSMYIAIENFYGIMPWLPEPIIHQEKDQSTQPPVTEKTKLINPNHEFWFIPRDFCHQVLNTNLIDEKTLSFYPNPAHDFIHINIDDYVNTKIINPQGKSVLTSTSSTIDVSQLPSGVYILNVQTHNAHISKSIVIK